MTNDEQELIRDSISWIEGYIKVLEKQTWKWEENRIAVINLGRKHVDQLRVCIGLPAKAQAQEVRE